MKNPITSSQKEQVARFSADAARIEAQEVVDQIEKNGSIDKDALQRVIEAKGEKNLTGRIRALIAEHLPSIILELAMVMLGHLKVVTAGTVKVTSMPKMKTVDCLVQDGTLIGWRDGDFDSWLSKLINAVIGGTLNCLELTKTEGTTYREITEAMLGTTDTDDELKKQLREREMTFHPQQVRDLIQRTEQGENTGLHKDGKANLFPIEDGDGKVFWLDVHRHGRAWHVDVNQFDYDFRWRQGNRAFSRNKV